MKTVLQITYGRFGASNCGGQVNVKGKIHHIALVGFSFFFFILNTSGSEVNICELEQPSPEGKKDKRSRW